MFLKSFSVHNYKSTREPCEIGSLGIVNSLIGPNNEGKSTILEAINLIRHVTKPIGDQSAEEYFGERLTDKSNSNRLMLKAEFEVTNEELESAALVAVAGQSQGFSFTFEWGGQINGWSPTFIYPVEMRLIQSTGTPIELVQMDRDQANPTMRVPNDLQAMIRGRDPGYSDLNWDQYIHKFRSDDKSLPPAWLLGNWARGIEFIPTDRSIDIVGTIGVDTSTISSSSLPARLNLMKNRHESQYQDFESLIRELMPTIKRVYTHPEGGSVTSIRVSNIDVDDTEQAYKLDNVGHGVMEILYLAAAIWLSPDGTTLLIEEPERGLHASSQRLLMKSAFAHAQEHNKQIFWATHSTVLAPIAENYSVHLVGAPDGRSTIATNIGIDEAQSISQALGHFNTDLYGFDLIVLCDGDSENVVLPDIVKFLLGTHSSASIAYHRINGDLRSRAEVVSQLITVLWNNHTSIFIFTDDDAGAKDALGGLFRRFRVKQEFTSAQAHIWDCGITSQENGGRGAEFEDNFSMDELITAANQLAQGTALDEAGLDRRYNASPNQKISKILDKYFNEIYRGGWSKVELNRILGALALSKIKANDSRGRDGATYEFEEVIKTKLAALVSNSD